MRVPAQIPQVQRLGHRAGQPDRPEGRVFPGRPDQVAAARDFVRQTIGPVPVLDEAVLLVSELCTNALQHTSSGEGGTFEVVVLRDRRVVRVDVRDNGSGHVPTAHAVDSFSEAGRGLGLVDLIADRWGYIAEFQSGGNLPRAWLRSC
jgi:anti-sigma regulatory factor (Ser/Thr protein kinase)